MPELPEVQVLVNDLNAAGISSRVITGVAVWWPASICLPDHRDFVRALIGRRVTGIRRRGKFILWQLDDNRVMGVHLRMSGRFILVSHENLRPRHVHVEFAFDDHRRLWFHDTRKFGRFYLADTAEAICGHLGLEPLSPGFSAKALAQTLARHHRELKPLLLDQSIVAGLGNIYVDEALWTAGLHPRRRSDDLSVQQSAALHRAIRAVLRQGIQHSGTSLGQGRNNFSSLGVEPGSNARFLKVYRRTGQPCPRCRHLVERIVVAQRSTHICPRCQV